MAVALVVTAVRRPESRAAAAPQLAVSSAPQPSGGDHWLDVLERLDRWRAQAWLTGRPALLTRVYTPSSEAIRSDRAMLAEYRARGLRADGVELAFLSAHVVARRPHRVVLATLDRLAPVRVRVVGDGHASLPADQPTAHVIVLRAVGPGWRIAAVRGAPAAQSKAASS